MVKYRVSIDIGGTFTDLTALNEENGEVLNVKLPSTPREPARAVIETFEEFIRRTENPDVSAVTHATTIASNALLGQLNLELPKTALITTKGFRDVIQIGRQRRHQLYNLFIEKPVALIPRRLRFEVEERMGPKGEVLTPIIRTQAKNLMQELKREEVEAAAVVLLFSHINREHEVEIGRMLKQTLPNVYVSLSSEVAPEHREYERTSTTVVNAVLMPIVSRYLSDLQRRLRRSGVKSPMLIMQSDGGIATKNVVSKKPAGIIESGPAAGVIASAFYGRLLGTENVLSFDMGGTTAKAGAIKDAQPEVVSEYEVAGQVHSGRIVKGSGYPVRYPFIDLAECSAGGGTIAWVDEAEALQVGPISAGAEPGPACYGKSGRQPTVTDANVVLGRLNPQYLLGGEMRIYKKLSEKAISTEICDKIRLEPAQAAAGIIKIVSSMMGKILRIVSIERGHDPRGFVLMCFGGAGPMHGCELAEDLDVTEVVVPPNPGLFSAYGLLAADYKNDQAKAVMKLVDEVDIEETEASFRRLELEGAKLMEKQRVPKARMHFIRQMDLRYFGQSYELPVETFKPITKKVFHQTTERFHKRHLAIYGYAVEDEPVELVNIKLTTIGLVEKPKLDEKPLHREKPFKQAKLGKREVFFEQNDGYVETAIYSRQKLRPGNRLTGPAIIEQYDATTVVYPDWKASIDRFQNIILSIKRR